MSNHINLEKRRQAIYGWLMLSPAALMLSIFAFYPSGATFFSSLFSKHTRRRPSEFIGIELFYFLLADPSFCLVFINYSMFSTSLVS